MAKRKLYLMPHLQVFADGAAAAGTGADTAADGTTGVTAAAAGQQRRGVKNPLADVIYGKVDTDGAVAQVANAQETDDTAQEIDADSAFDAMIKGEYKQQFDKRVQDIVQRRLKGTKETVENYEKLTPLREMLGRKYGVDASDVEALTKAIENDDSYYEQEALERGISVEDLKTIRKMERENETLKAQIQNADREKQIEQDISRWMAQAEEAKKAFPNLDLGVELQNPQFVELLKSNIDVQTAYWAVHNRELLPQMMQYTAAKTQQQVAQNIAAGNARRATENGTLGNSAAVVKSDVSKLTRADREEIDRRVARGERIAF